VTPEPVDDEKGGNENFGNQILSMNLFPRENCLKCKGKGKVIPITGLCGPEGGYRYSSTLP